MFSYAKYLRMPKTELYWSVLDFFGKLSKNKFHIKPPGESTVKQHSFYHYQTCSQQPTLINRRQSLHRKFIAIITRLKHIFQHVELFRIYR